MIVDFFLTPITYIIAFKRTYRQSPFGRPPAQRVNASSVQHLTTGEQGQYLLPRTVQDSHCLKDAALSAVVDAVQKLFYL